MTFIEIEVDEFTEGTSCDLAPVQSWAMSGRSHGQIENLAVQGYCAFGDEDMGLDTVENITDKEQEQDKEGEDDEPEK